jgi:hypothetical protein
MDGVVLAGVFLYPVCYCGVYCYDSYWLNFRNIYAMKRLLIASAIALLFIGCSTEPTNVKEPTKGYEPQINYYRDCRTALCFAEIVQGTKITGHACVPCDSIKKFLKRCEP